MADVNRWHRQIERRVLLDLKSDVAVLRAASNTVDRDDKMQRRMATRIVILIDAKLEKLDEQDEAA